MSSVGSRAASTLPRTHVATAMPNGIRQRGPGRRPSGKRKCQNTSSEKVIGIHHHSATQANSVLGSAPAIGDVRAVGVGEREEADQHAEQSGRASRAGSPAGPTGSVLRLAAVASAPTTAETSPASRFPSAAASTSAATPARQRRRTTSASESARANARLKGARPPSEPERHVQQVASSRARRPGGRRAAGRARPARGAARRTPRACAARRTAPVETAVDHALHARAQRQEQGRDDQRRDGDREVRAARERREQRLTREHEPRVRHAEDHGQRAVDERPRDHRSASYSR